MLHNEQIQYFHQFGYLLLRDVFTTAEVDKLRTVCEIYGKGEILGRKAFGHILLDDRIIHPLKQLLGENLVYFGESNASTTIGSRHMHNDSKNDDFDFSTPYPVVRIGLYLQDHENHSGGLKLRPGSHKKYCIDKNGIGRAYQFLKRTRNLSALYTGKSINVPTRPGDLLIWNMRTHHSGHAVRVKGLKNYSFHPWTEDRIPAFLHHPDHEKRAVIFASYGTPTDLLEDYIKNRTERHNKRIYWNECSKQRFDTPEILELARMKGVIIRADGIEKLAEIEQMENA